MIVGIVFVESGQRRIPVQFAKRVVGRRMYGGQSTYIPLKVNQSGVIPVIFASSILAFPALIASALGNNGHGIQAWINNNLVQNQSWFYILFYTILIIFFAYFYTAIAFNPPTTSRHHPQAGRVHSRNPSRATDGAVPRQDVEPHHAARVAVPRHDRRGAAARRSRFGTSASSPSGAPRC